MTASRLAQSGPSYFNFIDVNVDEHGAVTTFHRAVFQEVLHEDERTGKVACIDQLTLSDGTRMWPVEQYSADGENSPLIGVANDLTTVKPSLGENALRTYDFEGELQRIERARMAMSTTEREKELFEYELERSRDLRNIFHREQTLYPYGLWLSFEFMGDTAMPPIIYAARIALLIVHDERPGIVPIVFEAGSSSVGLLPQNVTINEPWLYATQPRSEQDS